MDTGKKLGFSYGILHFCVEVICFFTLFKFFKNEKGVIFIYAFLYDFLAFVPQFLFGQIYDKFRKSHIQYLAVLLFLIATLTMGLNDKILTLFLITIANAILHETGAVVTTLHSGGKLSPTAIFVAGGSFGVITGQLLARLNINHYFLLLFILLIFIILISTKKYFVPKEYPVFDIVKKNTNATSLIFIVLFIVSIRSFIAYAIPISWKKEVWQAVLLFFTMGLGKALGGILSDKFGARKIGILSTSLCIPFLLFGENNMIISILGICMFSMTMPITFAMLLSKFKNNAGLCFGITTIGLFIGVVPVFLLKTFPKIVNIILVITMSLICTFLFFKTLKTRKED